MWAIQPPIAGHSGTPGTDEPVSGLVRRASRQLAELGRGEMRPAQSEVKEKGKRFGRGGGLFGDAGAAGRPMTQALVATAIAALAVPLHVRAVAALIVTAVPGVIAAVPAMSGRRQIKEGAPPTPERTVESVKTDMARIKESAQQ